MNAPNQPADQIVKLLAGLLKVLTSKFGWLLTGLSSILTFFASEQYAFIVVLGAIFIDAYFGASVSLRGGKFLMSKLARDTVFKITAYGACLVMVFMLEKLVHEQGFVGVKMAAAWALACEFWSTSANILIIWPEATFFKIMRRHLRGEIAAKLGVHVDDLLVEEKRA